MTTTTEKMTQIDEKEEEKSFFGIIVHSFFIIPFLIAVFCVLLFTGINLLTRENRSAYNYLEDVKTGGSTKRWQGAFELSKILSNPVQVPQDERFVNELTRAFEHARHDDNRVRQYLALAMGRTGNPVYVEPLINGLKDEKEENLAALIYALGMLRKKEAAKVLYQYVDHPDARVRSITTVALGNMRDPQSIQVLTGLLSDAEANVQWGAAISLAQMGNFAGKEILLKLLNRDYLDDYSAVDPQEQNNLMISAIKAVAGVQDQEVYDQLKAISVSDKNMKVRAAALQYVNTY